MSSFRSLPENQTSGPKYRQITEHLRELINRGDLPAGTRLPPAKQLAKQWKTNHFTIQLALKPLANEGLIERKPRSGTYVRDRKERLSSVGIYYGANLWKDPEGQFYQYAYDDLQETLRDRDVRLRTFIDTRRAHQRALPFSDLAKAVEQREIQGIIGLMLTAEDTKWLKNLGIPFSHFSISGSHIDYQTMIGSAFDRLASQGCKSVGLIATVPVMGTVTFDSVKELALKRGLTMKHPWFMTTGPKDQSEPFGYQAFKEIWANQRRPDGVFIYPDWVCRGAILSILQLGVDVPQDMNLVLYRNVGLDYICPWQVPQVVIDIKKVAVLLVDHLERLHRTGNLDHVPPLIPFELVP
jgi:DNA-binding LacI/PurR family transcriptional regulator